MELFFWRRGEYIQNLGTKKKRNQCLLTPLTYLHPWHVTQQHQQQPPQPSANHSPTSPKTVTASFNQLHMSHHRPSLATQLQTFRAQQQSNRMDHTQVQPWEKQALEGPFLRRRTTCGPGSRHRASYQCLHKTNFQSIILQRCSLLGCPHPHPHPRILQRILQHMQPQPQSHRRISQ